MTPILREPLNSPAAWLGAEMRQTDEWMHRLTPEEIADLDAAVATAKATGKALGDLTPADFPITTLGQAIREWNAILEHGRGFLLVRGVPVEQYTEDEAAIAYWGIGLYMGEPVSQNSAGDLLGHVRDTGADADDPTVRLYKTRVNLGFHTDGADIIGLLCLQQGKSGGVSRIVSSVSLYNEILRRRPDLIDLLYEPWHFDSHGQQTEGMPPFFTLPLCYHEGDRLRTFYVDWYIRQAQRHPEVPRLTPEREEVLALIHNITEDPAFNLEMDFEPGDMQFLKNAVNLHARTEYEDWDEPERKRHLLRLWLTAYEPEAADDLMLQSGIPTKADFDDDTTAFAKASQSDAAGS